jgi:hypothetical protein
MWALVVAAALGIGLGALISAVAANNYAKAPSSHPNWDPTSISNSGLSIAQLAIGVLASLFHAGMPGHDGELQGASMTA